MGPPSIISDPATLVAIVWLIFAAFSSLVDAFYASKIAPKAVRIIRNATRTSTSKKTVTKRLILSILLSCAALLILSTIVLATNTGAVGTRPSPQVLIAPVQIQTSDRDQVFKDIARFFLRDLHERPHVRVVLTQPVPPPTVSTVSSSPRWPTSSNNMATQLSSLMPMVIIYGTQLAVISGMLDINGPHLLPVMVVVACTAIRQTSRSDLHLILFLLRAERVLVVRMTLASAWALLQDLVSSFIYWIELGLTLIGYLIGLGGTVIRNVNSLVYTHSRYSITSVLTQLPRTFRVRYTIAIATLLLAKLLVSVLMRRYHVLLRRAAATALKALALRLDPSPEHGILAQDPSTSQAQEVIKGVIEAKKDQEDVPAVEVLPEAISPSCENVPVDLSVSPILGTGLTINKGPKEIYESNRSLLQTMMNDRRLESTRSFTIHPPPATLLAAIEDLLKSPASILSGSPRKIDLTRSEFVYVLMGVLEECNRRHRTVHDGLVKNNERMEVRIRIEARKNQALALELNTLKSTLKRTCESTVKRKDIRANAACMGDSVLHQVEDGKTASASKLELAATSTHAGGTAKPLTEGDIINDLQGLLSDLRGLRNLVRAMLMPEHCSPLDKCYEVDASSGDLTPHPRVCDLVEDCNFARIEISRVISLLAIQRSADSKHNHAVLKKQQAFREELSDRVSELRGEYEVQLKELCQRLEREKEAHSQTKAFNDFYIRLHCKRENSLQEEVDKRKVQVKQLLQDISSLQRKVKDTEALKEALLRPDNFKEWALQWLSIKGISRVTGTVLEERYRSTMKDLDKVTAHVNVLTTQSDLLNQHVELLQYICSKLFKLDTDAPSSIPKNRRL